MKHTGETRENGPSFSLLSSRYLLPHQNLSNARAEPEGRYEKGLPLKCWGSKRRGDMGIGFNLAICSHFDRERFLRKEKNNKRSCCFSQTFQKRINPLGKANPKFVQWHDTS